MEQALEGCKGCKCRWRRRWKGRIWIWILWGAGSGIESNYARSEAVTVGGPRDRGTCGVSNIRRRDEANWREEWGVEIGRISSLLPIPVRWWRKIAKKDEPSLDPLRTPSPQQQPILLRLNNNTIKMCLRGTCSTCSRASWFGCGKHIPQVMDRIPESERCTCTPQTERDGKLYPPMTDKADWVPGWAVGAMKSLGLVKEK